MHCPRCKTDMNQVNINGVQVDVCPGCEGSWYDNEELSAIIGVPKGKLEESELSQVLVEDKTEGVDLEGGIVCPRCGSPLRRFRYLVSSEIWLDECSEHGVWLDDGELAKMLDFLKGTEVDPETAARLEAEMDAIRREHSSRLATLADPRLGKLGSKIIERISRLFKTRC